jgi:hypothetical protein
MEKAIAERFVCSRNPETAEDDEDEKDAERG